jgi:hypothetical protein
METFQSASVGNPDTHGYKRYMPPMGTPMDDHASTAVGFTQILKPTHTDRASVQVSSARIHTMLNAKQPKSVSHAPKRDARKADSTHDDEAVG